MKIERVIYNFGLMGYVTDSKKKIPNIKMEPYIDEYWNLIPGEETTALGLFSRPLEFVGWRQEYRMLFLYFSLTVWTSSSSGPRYWVIEVPLLMEKRKFGEVESPFSILLLPGYGGEILYVPGKGWMGWQEGKRTLKELL